VETFGVWSPLYSIADRTTVQSGEVAWRNLLQQLSVSPWSNNVRMVLRYWTLQGGDNDFPGLISCIVVIVGYRFNFSVHGLDLDSSLCLYAILSQKHLCCEKGQAQES